MKQPPGDDPYCSDEDIRAKDTNLCGMSIGAMALTHRMVALKVHQ